MKTFTSCLEAFSKSVLCNPGSVNSGVEAGNDGELLLLSMIFLFFLKKDFICLCFYLRMT